MVSFVQIIAQSNFWSSFWEPIRISRLSHPNRLATRGRGTIKHYEKNKHVVISRLQRELQTNRANQRQKPGPDGSQILHEKHGPGRRSAFARSAGFCRRGG